MPSEWIVTTIGEQVTLQRGIDITKAQQQEGSVPVISSGGVSSFHDKAVASGPGVILGRKGVVGSVYFASSDYWPHDTTLWVKDFRGNHPRFVYYFFLWMAPQLTTMDVGSANPTLNRNHVHPIEIRWPPVPEQRAIASILGTIDDKFELNRRTNETLEATARTIFKSWFVDFDPVRAKRDGDDTGLPQELSDLFPGCMNETELGEIPKGWKIQGLDEIARFINGLALQRFPPKAGRSLPVIKIAQLRAGGTNGADTASADLEPDYIVENGDILFSWSGSLECVLWTGGRGALNQHLFKVTSANYPKWFSYLWINQHLPGFRHIAAAKATTMGHIQRHHLSEAKVIIPDEKLMSAADKVINPLLTALIRNRLESRTLGVLRDALLPKLISGEIRVKYPERIKGSGL